MARKASPSRSPREQRKPQSPAPRAPRRGLGWLFLFALGCGLLALFVFAPDALREALGGSPAPRQLGDEPSLAQDQGAGLETRAVAIEGRNLSGDVGSLARERVIEEPERIPEAPIREAPREQFPDAARGQDILGRAEEAYANYRWDEARSLASSILTLDVPDAVKLRARDISSGTQRLRELFDVLGTREELVRNLETHPSLVEIVQRGRPNRVIPVNDLRDREPVQTDDPVAWIRERLQGDSVPVLFENNIASNINAGDISEVRPVDTAAIIAERRAILDARVAEFENDIDMRNDPMAWYEAAKFAYRNRIDDAVVEMLDRALLLSPDLGQTIREDAAQEWFTKLIMAMEAENRAAANGYMVQIQRYQDTLVYPQARAYFDGNMEAVRAAREEAVAAQRRQREEARERRIERAQVQGDQEAVASIQREVQQEQTRREERAARVSSPAGGADMGAANQNFDRGMSIYQEAQAMGATRERDQKYRQARGYFLAALEVYAAAVERGDLSVEARMTQTNQLQYACMKYARSF